MAYPDGMHHEELDEQRFPCAGCGIVYEEQDLTETDCGLVCPTCYDDGFCQVDDHAEEHYHEDD